MTTSTMIEQFADFAVTTTFDALPEEVIHESKRLLLDSLGCSIAGLSVEKGTTGVDVGQELGGSDGPATIFGSAQRSSVLGAAFANGETMNALDFDAVLPPGHVVPYVLPAALALAEVRGASGRDLLRAIALAQEISFRFSRAMDYLRNPTPEGMKIAEVLGFSSTIFGAVAAIGVIEGFDRETMADALGIAAAVSPVNSYRTWVDNVPNSSIKYTMPGPLVQAALAAAMSAKFGHSGDRRILDDADYGYRRFIGSTRWEPANLTTDLGAPWAFPGQTSYKPYPQCRVMHAPLDIITEIVMDQRLDPTEIDAIRCWGEGWVEQPVWLNNEVTRPHEAQFSIAHGLAVGAHVLPPGPEWQTEQTLYSPSVLALMDKVTFAPHPEYLAALSGNGSARPTRVEIDARGTTFAGTRDFPKGTPSSDPTTRMDDAELTQKFRANALLRLDAENTEAIIAGVLGLEDLPRVSELIAASGAQKTGA